MERSRGADLRSGVMQASAVLYMTSPCTRSIRDGNRSVCWMFLDAMGLKAYLLHPLSICLFLSPSLNLFYYLCSAPSAVHRSPVSPVEPDDMLRLLQLATRNSRNTYICTRKHAYIYISASLSHTHALTHTCAVAH